MTVSGNIVSTPTTYISCKTTPVQLTTGQVNQIYVSGVNGALTCQVTATPGTFPANVLPICEVTVDSVSLLRNIFDWRPSYI